MREGNHEETGIPGPGERVQERQTPSQVGGIVEGRSHGSHKLSETTFPELGSVRVLVENFAMG